MQKSFKSLIRICFKKSLFFNKFSKNTNKFLFSRISSNNITDNSKSIASLEEPDIKEQAKRALEEGLKQETEKFSLENKTFTAKIGENTLTYTCIFIRKNDNLLKIYGFFSG